MDKMQQFTDPKYMSERCQTVCRYRKSKAEFVLSRLKDVERKPPVHNMFIFLNKKNRWLRIDGFHTINIMSF